MTTRASAVVRAEAATLTYDTIRALDEVTISVPSGQKVALVGPSGAGKSSLLAAIAGRVELNSGVVHTLGHALQAPPSRQERATRRRIGIVAQGLDLALPLRVVHNVHAGRLGVSSTLAAMWALLRPRQSNDVRGVLAAVGLEDRLLSRTSDLSGGERQRVAIARVLFQRPELLLADEPTASVDPKLADQMMALLCEGDHTLVVSAHDPALAKRHVDRIVGMRNGKIVLDRCASEIDDRELADFYDH